MTINEYIKQYGLKHFSRFIKKDIELYTKIKEYSDKFNISNITEQIYLYENNIIPLCSFNKKRKFVSYTKGYAFCGKASICKCAKDSVSLNVKKTKATHTYEQKQIIQNKREETNLKKYGVCNVGQTEQAKLAHALFYSDENNIRRTVQNYKNTMIKKYGVENIVQLSTTKDKIKNTLLNRYGVENISKTDRERNRRSKLAKKMAVDGIFLKFGYEKVKKTLKEKCEVSLLCDLSEYTGTYKGTAYQVKCDKCEHKFEMAMWYGKLHKCKICHPTKPSFTSKEEQEVFDYIQSLGVTSYQSDKRIINPYELDIVCPTYKIAIEYGGLFWHSERYGHKNKSYHETKMKLANEKGYRLITIFSDEWINGQEKVKNTLRQIFGKNNKTIYARKCQILPISAKQTNEFYEKFHNIGGNCGGSIHIGLYSTDSELVACMSFQKSRGFNRHKNLGDKGYNLVRFSTNGSNVPGAASKCLSYFKNNYDWDFIFTYADLRWSEGNLYKKLGFTDDGIDPPTFYYVPPDYETREHRFNHRKKAYRDIFDINVMTEKEIMDILGYDRIWDCGRLRYLMIK